MKLSLVKGCDKSMLEFKNLKQDILVSCEKSKSLKNFSHSGNSRSFFLDNIQNMFGSGEVPHKIMRSNGCQ